MALELLSEQEPLVQATSAAAPRSYAKRLLLLVALAGVAAVAASFPRSSRVRVRGATTRFFLDGENADVHPGGNIMDNVTDHVVEDNAGGDKAAAEGAGEAAAPGNEVVHGNEILGDEISHSNTGNGTMINHATIHKGEAADEAGASDGADTAAAAEGAGESTTPAAVPADAADAEAAKGAEEAPMCCKAMTAQCLACAERQTVTEYCADKQDTDVCDKVADDGALPAEGEKPAVGGEVAEDGALPAEGDKPAVGGEGKMCCAAMTASCLACTAGQTAEEYCAAKPSTHGCEKEQAPSDHAEDDAGAADGAGQEAAPADVADAEVVDAGATEEQAPADPAEVDAGAEKGAGKEDAPANAADAAVADAGATEAAAADWQVSEYLPELEGEMAGENEWHDIQSVDDCKKKCGDTADCAAFVWMPPFENDPSPGHCYPKKAIDGEYKWQTSEEAKKGQFYYKKDAGAQR